MRCAFRIRAEQKELVLGLEIYVWDMGAIFSVCVSSNEGW